MIKIHLSTYLFYSRANASNLFLLCSSSNDPICSDTGLIFVSSRQAFPFCPDSYREPKKETKTLEKVNSSVKQTFSAAATQVDHVPNVFLTGTLSYIFLMRLPYLFDDYSYLMNTTIIAK